MESIRKWFYKPKRDDPSLLAQFFYADEALNLVAAELDSFDGRKDPERCTALVNHLRQCQDKVLTICNRIMDDVIPLERANRDFRVKFPDDVMQENLAGQLWFGAECLAAGSSIMNREGESSAMRPLAKALTKALENVRNLLREQCLRGNTSTNSLKPNIASGFNEIFGERLQEALKIFDRLFAEFELCYVSAMVPVKSTKEYELQQLVVVLFSETLQRALKMKLLTQEMVDDYDPALMFTIPRLAIVSGLLIFPDGPLCLDRTPADMSEMFRPFRTLLHKIRELLWTLNNKELFTLEKLLCSSEEPLDFRNTGQSVEIQDAAESIVTNTAPTYPTVPDLDDFVTRFYIDYPSCKQFVTDFYATSSRNMESEPQNSNNSGVNASRSSESFINVSNSSKTETEANLSDNVCCEVIPSWESNEESEDETEWVGETSECETVVTDAYNESVSVFETEEIVSSVESDCKTLVSLPEDSSSQINSPSVSTEHPNLKEQQSTSLSSSSSCASHLDFQEQNSSMESQNYTERLMTTTSDLQDNECSSQFASSDTIEIPTSGTSGFLLANQVGHESILASIERLSPRIPDLSPGGGGSLPDGDSREALSVATATLSTLLMSSPNISPVDDISRHQENDVEEDSSLQSPLDSGVGTVVSCSDTGSFSDRSPDTASASVLVSNENRGTVHSVESVCLSDSTAQTCYNIDHKAQQWQVETIPCSCTLSEQPTISSNSNKCVNKLKNSVVESVVLTSGVGDVDSIATESSSNIYVERLTVVRTCNNNICDNNLSSNSTNNGENFVMCQKCLLSMEMENSDKGNLISSKLESCNVLSAGQEEFTNFTSSDGNKCDQVLYSETVTRDLSSDLSSLESNSQEKSVLMSYNLGDYSYDGTDVSHSPVYNASLPQDLNLPDECIDNAVPTAFLVNGSHNDETVAQIGTYEHNKTLPRIVVKTDEDSIKTDEDGQCTLCNSSDGDVAQCQTSEHLLNYSGNWEHLMKKHEPVTQNSSSEPNTSQSELRAHGNMKVKGSSRKTCIQPSSSNITAPCLTTNVTYQQGGSTLEVVPSRTGRSLDVPLASSYSSTSSSCQSSITLSSDSCSMSSETSSFNSECQDDEEIALAIQAAEIANRNEARAKFRSSEDLVHRLFVCIAGVADQLQTNFAGDLRHILKCVFLMSASSSSSVEEQDVEESSRTVSTEHPPPSPPDDNDFSRPVESAEEALTSGWESPTSPVEVESPPPWIPDDMAPRCMSCEAIFTVVRRRHHCRNCGKVFCARCSSNSVPLPRYGHVKPVRVCNRCFLYQVTPFTLEELATRS